MSIEDLKFMLWSWMTKGSNWRRNSWLQMFLQNFLTFFQIISDDGYVATANSKTFFEDMDDIPIWTCQGASCNPLAEAISQAVAHRIPTKLHPKEGEKVKARAGCSGLPNTPLCTYHHSEVAQIALQVWWCRRQDYIAMWQSTPQQIRS